MARYELLVKGGDVLLPSGAVLRCDVAASAGRISRIDEEIDASQAEEVVDARGRLVLPGAVDAHFHLGIYRPLAEDARSETASALVGGVTTVLSYFRTGRDYLNKVGPYREIFPELLRAVEGNAYTDYGFHIAVMTAAQLEEVPWLVDQGVASFKYYMFYKALNLSASSTRAQEYTLADNYDLGHLYELMERVAAEAERRREAGRVSLSIHCENAELIRVFIERVKRRGAGGLKAYSEARPPLSERLAVMEAAVLADATRCPVNFLHLSSREAIEAVDLARRTFPGLDLRAETTLHHLALTWETAAGGINGKVNPPIREARDVEALWDAVRSGRIDEVVSDHASMDEAKPEDLWEARSGFGGTALLYPLMLTEGFLKRNVPLARIADLVSGGPARLFGLAPRKGTISVGADADLAVVDLETEHEVEPERLLSAQPFTPFEGMRLKGWPEATVVGGRVAYRDGRPVGEPRGRYVRRPVAVWTDSGDGELRKEGRA